MQTIYTVKTCNSTVKRPSQQGTILLSSLWHRPPPSLNIHSLFWKLHLWLFSKKGFIKFYFFLSVYVKAGTQVTEITWTCKGCVIFNTSTYLRLTFPETFTQNLTKGNSILVSLIAFTHPCTVFYFHKEKTKHIPVKDGNPILWLRIQETRQGADHGVKNVTWLPPCRILDIMLHKNLNWPRDSSTN